MSLRVSSAPGKVILSGEYAVLDGAAAVSMAVNRRAVVSVDASEHDSVRSLGLGGKNDSRMLVCVLSALSLPSRHGAAVLDTREFSDGDTGTKLGLGSSAALGAAIARALAPTDAGGDALFAIALEAHREFQGGRGSGVDVATSVLGGLVEYRIGASPRSLRWPEGLHFRVLWSGQAASTEGKLDRLLASGSSPSRAALGDAATSIAGLWSGGAAAALVAAYPDYVAALRRFDLDHALGIFDAGHDELAHESRSFGLVYKPCGAGGGDVGIVLGLDDDAVQAFAADAVGRGFRILDVTLDAQGASLERGRS